MISYWSYCVYRWVSADTGGPWFLITFEWRRFESGSPLFLRGITLVSIVDFRQLLQRLVRHLQHQVRSGEMTERSLARVTGVSQPHLHHVLHGHRLLSIAMADRILHRLHLDLRELIEPDESEK